MTTTPPDPDAIRARCEAATPAPWEADDNDIWTADGDRFIGSPPRIADAEFIAHARTEIPALLDEIERQTAERDALAAKVARVEELAKHWLASNPDDRWAQALNATLAGVA